jgi:hypothetical protein
MRTQLFILIFLATVSCTKETSDTLEIREFSGNGYLNRTTKGKLVTRQTNDSIIYSYSSDTLNYDYVFTKIKKGDKRLLYYNTDLIFIDSKLFQIGEKEIIVDRFDYDDPTMSDEEASYFYVDNYGVISIQSEAWTHKTLFKKGEQLDSELLHLLESDTSGFYGYPPPRNM